MTSKTHGDHDHKRHDAYNLMHYIIKMKNKNK